MMRTQMLIHPGNPQSGRSGTAGVRLLRSGSGGDALVAGWVERWRPWLVEIALRPCRIVLAAVFLVPGCDSPVPEDQPEAFIVRDSAGVEIVENRAPMWDSAQHWNVESEPLFVIGGAGGATDAAREVSHLVWNIGDAVPLSDGRLAMLSSRGDNAVLVFEPSGELSASFGRKGRGPGEFTHAHHLQVLPGDTIVAWDYMFGPVGYFDPSGALLRHRGIDVGAMIAVATTSPGEVLNESMAFPFQDGSFLVEVHQLGGDRPTEGLYQPPLAYVRIDSAYSAHSFGWWAGPETLVIPPPAFPLVPFPARSIITGGGSPLSVYVAPHDRYEIRQFSKTGVLRRIIRRDVDPIPITSEETDERIQETVSMNPLWEWDAWRRAMARLPTRFHQTVRTLKVDSEGYLWVMDKREAITDEWSVYDQDGRWLTTLTLPSGRVTWIGDIVVTVRIDPDTGVETVEGYRLNRPAAR